MHPQGEKMIDPNEPAFPCPEFSWRDGMTVRTYLAGQALVGLNANTDFTQVESSILARWAVERADALIAELNKNKESK
jgi:hypothetical protein